jgi:hypothetical protein
MCELVLCGSMLSGFASCWIMRYTLEDRALASRKSRAPTTVNGLITAYCKIQDTFDGVLKGEKTQSQLYSVTENGILKIEMPIVLFYRVDGGAEALRLRSDHLGECTVPSNVGVTI